MRALLVLAFPAVALACGPERVRDRFGQEDASVLPDTPLPPDALPEIQIPDADETLGGPCVDDGQCARPELPCADFRCDRAVGRCRATPDDTRCDDGIHCNGVERCDPRVGCVPGPVVECGSGDTCRIDRCVEATRSCESVPRDADGDGDPTAACRGLGRDCDDSDPTVSSTAREVCGNRKDDNCDGVIDEPDCVLPANATCDDARVIAASGTYAVDLTGSQRSVGASCAAPTEWPRQVVLAVRIPDGPARDVDLVARGQRARVALASGLTCGDGTTETACAVQPPNASAVRTKLRALGPGTYPVYLFGFGEGPAEVTVTFADPTPPASNLTCATAAPLLDAATTRATFTSEIVDVGRIPTSCPAAAGPLLHRIDVTNGPVDLRVRATAPTVGVRPIFGLRDAGCASTSNEIRCATSNGPEFLVRGLQAGTWYLTIGATAPTDLVVDARITPATAPPADESCATAPPITNDATVLVPLGDRADDIAARCLAVGSALLAPDAAYRLSVDAPSDLLVVARASGNDSIGLGLSSPACISPDWGCARGTPARLSRRGLPAGDYRLIVESLLGATPSISTFVRPTVSVGPAGADRCQDPIVAIPRDGGFFLGTTAGRGAEIDASCDSAGGPKGGAPDVIYRLEVTERRRLVIDAAGSGFPVILALRRGDSCPGTEVDRGCAAGFVPENAFLDIVVDPGTYWLVVDGYGLAAGNYRLDVRVAPPP